MVKRGRLLEAEVYCTSVGVHVWTFWCLSAIRICSIIARGGGLESVKWVGLPSKASQPILWVNTQQFNEPHIVSHYSSYFSTLHWKPLCMAILYSKLHLTTLCLVTECYVASTVRGTCVFRPPTTCLSLCPQHGKYSTWNGTQWVDRSSLSDAGKWSHSLLELGIKHTHGRHK